VTKKTGRIQVQIQFNSVVNINISQNVSAVWCDNFSWLLYFNLPLNVKVKKMLKPVTI